MVAFCLGAAICAFTNCVLSGEKSINFLVCFAPHLNGFVIKACLEKVYSSL